MCFFQSFVNTRNLFEHHLTKYFETLNDSNSSFSLAGDEFGEGYSYAIEFENEKICNE